MRLIYSLLPFYAGLSDIHMLLYKQIWLCEWGYFKMADLYYVKTKIIVVIIIFPDIVSFQPNTKAKTFQTPSLEYIEAYER